MAPVGLLPAYLVNRAPHLTSEKESARLASRAGNGEGARSVPSHLRAVRTTTSIPTLPGL